MCKSYQEGFCYKWSFPVQDYHIPCTKINLREKPKEKGSVYEYKSYNSEVDSEVDSEIKLEGDSEVKSEVKSEVVSEVVSEVESEVDSKVELNKDELIHEFFNELIQFKERIIGKPFDEIYIELDGLLEKYEEKFNFDF